MINWLIDSNKMLSITYSLIVDSKKVHFMVSSKWTQWSPRLNNG